MKINETCSCGAVLMVDSAWSVDATVVAREFRKAHERCREVQHTEPTESSPARGGGSAG